MKNIDEIRYKVGGPVGKNSIYVNRNTDKLLYDYIVNNNETVVINGPRMIGKTSLAKKTIERIKESNNNILIAFFDFRGTMPPKDVEIRGVWWFKTILNNIAIQFGIDKEEMNRWLEKQFSIDKKTNIRVFIDFFKEFANSQKKHIIIFDEMDELMRHGVYTDDFFEAIDILHENKDDYHLSFVLIGNLPVSFLMKSKAGSSFRIGKLIRLPDFDVENKDILEQWSKGLVVKKKIALETTEYVLKQTGGIAFLTAFVLDRLSQLNKIAEDDITDIIDDLVKKGKNPIHGIGHFRAAEEFILESNVGLDVLNIYEEILDRKRETISDKNEEIIGVLVSSGIIRLKDNNNIELRSPVYTRVYDKKWIKNMYNRIVGSSYKRTSPNLYLTDKASKLCVINMGGTLGMVDRQGKMLPPSNEQELIEVYPILKSISSLEYIALDPKDGANVTVFDWERLSKLIFDKRNTGFDGFVIIHGTDTLQYTASAIAFALGDGLRFPVVFVGSQAPHTAFYGDAEINLRRAIRTALEDIPEVSICFGNNVYRAVRATKANDYDFQGFISATLEPLAVIGENIEINKTLIRNETTERIRLKNKFETNILQISQYPNLKPMHYYELLKENNYKGVVIESLGIGNLPTIEQYGWIPFIEQVIQDLDIPVIITSRYPITPRFIEKYIPAMKPIQAGAIHAGNMVGSTALVKLMWLLPQIEDDIKNGDLPYEEKYIELKRLMEFSYIGEIDNN